MFFLIVFFVLLFLGFHFPTLTKHFIIAPILGFVLGGFSWSIVAICSSTSFVSWSSFGAFILGGFLVTELFLMKMD
jgi:hypothetical protein